MCIGILIVKPKEIETTHNASIILIRKDIKIKLQKMAIVRRHPHLDEANRPNNEKKNSCTWRTINSMLKLTPIRNKLHVV